MEGECFPLSSPITRSFDGAFFIVHATFGKLIEESKCSMCDLIGLPGACVCSLVAPTVGARVVATQRRRTR